MRNPKKLLLYSAVFTCCLASCPSVLICIAMHLGDISDVMGWSSIVGIIGFSIIAAVAAWSDESREVTA